MCSANVRAPSSSGQLASPLSTASQNPQVMLSIPSMPSSALSPPPSHLLPLSSYSWSCGVANTSFLAARHSHYTSNWLILLLYFKASGCLLWPPGPLGSSHWEALGQLPHSPCTPFLQTENTTKAHFLELRSDCRVSFSYFSVRPGENKAFSTWWAKYLNLRSLKTTNLPRYYFCPRIPCLSCSRPCLVPSISECFFLHDLLSVFCPILECVSSHLCWSKFTISSTISSRPISPPPAWPRTSATCATQPLCIDLHFPYSFWKHRHNHVFPCQSWEHHR